MRMVRSLSILLLINLMSGSFAVAQPDIQLTSPNNRIVFDFAVKDDIPRYGVRFDDRELIESSPLTLELDRIGILKEGFLRSQPIYKEISETYSLPVGKASHVKNHYKQVTIPLAFRANSNYQLNIEVRAFNDGIAFRYVFPKQAAT